MSLTSHRYAITVVTYHHHTDTQLMHAARVTHALLLMMVKVTMNSWQLPQPRQCECASSDSAADQGDEHTEHNSTASSVDSWAFHTWLIQTCNSISFTASSESHRYHLLIQHVLILILLSFYCAGCKLFSCSTFTQLLHYSVCVSILAI